MQCCELGCLATLSPAAGAKSWNFLETQHALWAAAEGRKGRLSALLSFMYDTTTGSISSRCMRSFKLQLGVSNYLLQLVHTALVKGHTEESVEDKKSRLLAQQHGNAGSQPWNKMKDSVLQLLIQEFDLATLSTPENDTIRPNRCASAEALIPYFNDSSIPRLGQISSPFLSPCLSIKVPLTFAACRSIGISSMTKLIRHILLKHPR